MQTWRDIISALRLVGYDHVMSIEHEDSIMTPTEGLEKAIDFLKKAIIFQPKPTSISWA
jgi:sugar phosphate isomerase/epimerase